MPSLRALALVAAVVEVFLLGLVAVAPVGGVAQSISPLARVWPWLLAPARLIFGDALVRGSLPPERGWPALALFVTLLLGASCAAALALPLCRRAIGASPRHLALALGAAAVLGATLVLLPSLPSDDVFSYILYGRISVLHHANPLIAAPSSFPSDPFLQLVFWQGTRSVYGPAWLLLSGALTRVAGAFGGSLATYVLLYKVLGLAAHLANVVLIWAILGLRAPRRQLFGTLLYAWNPLCLLEFCASGHNDALMLTFALAGIYCLLRAWEVPALICFGLSISVKYVLLALVPLYLVLVARMLWARRQTLPAVAGAVAWRAAVVLGVVALTAVPFWAGPRTFGAILYSPPAQKLDNSLLEMLQWPLRSLAQALGASRDGAANAVEGGLKALGLVIFAGLWLRELRRTRDVASMLRGWGWVLCWYAVIASVWFWPWYATWAVALAAVAVSDELSTAALLLAGGALTLYGFLPLYASGIYGFRALVAFGPVLLYVLWWRRRAVGHALNRVLRAHV
ncbi:MAG: hypothetical protein ACHQ4H_11810 [Ktedonobacterales bacterium]